MRVTSPELIIVVALQVQGVSCSY